MIDVADNNAVYYYHFDGLCSVVALSDVNNVIVERYSYDVFGQPTIYIFLELLLRSNYEKFCVSLYFLFVSCVDIFFGWLQRGKTQQKRCGNLHLS